MRSERIRKTQSPCAKFLTAVLLLMLFFVYGIGNADKVKPTIPLPPPGFELDQTRSDPDRLVRKFKKPYQGPIFDTHAHLDPPRMRRGSLVEAETAGDIVKSIRKAGVDRIIIMPVPNEGQMGGSREGAKYRKKLLKKGRGIVYRFCGSQYITNWLHDAYHNGYRSSDLDRVLEKLSKDLSASECRGIGEIGLYHFNKTGMQNVIAYPPNFEPFLEIVGRIAKKGAWLDFHAEPVDPHGKSYEKKVFGGLALLYNRYPNLKLIIAHTAMTNATNVRRILKTYPNAMMHFKPIRKHRKWRNLEPITDSKGRLYQDWAELFEEMPQRFMVGTDEKFGRISKGDMGPKGRKVSKYPKQIGRMRTLLGSLDPKVAEFMAYKNANRIFAIK